MLRLFAAIALCWLPFSSLAQDVTLTSRDGEIEVSGALIGFDGEFYRVETEYGALTVDGSGVDCVGPGCPDLSAYVAEVNFSGAPIVGSDLLPALFQAFARQERYDYAVEADETGRRIVLRDPEFDRDVARITVEDMNVDEGFAHLIAGQTDIVMATRAALPLEVAWAKDAGLGQIDSVLQTRVIALDAIVPVVSLRNPVRAITLRDLVRVYTGGIDNWAELGGVDAPIYRHGLGQDNAAQVLFQERILLPEGANFSTTITQHPDQDALNAAVRKDPFAMGLARLVEVEGLRALELRGDCGFVAVANAETLKTYDYPLHAPLYLYQRKGRLPRIVREFLRFTQTPAAQITVLRAGFVDQALGTQMRARQGERLANAVMNAGNDVTLSDLQDMVHSMEGRSRLTLTFRFKESSSELDAQSQSNVALLARALEAGTLTAKELIFVGFSDGEGAASANRRLSEERARRVRSAVLGAAPTFDPRRVDIETAGYGEALPLACDDTGWGRSLNRRVEVWVK